MFSKIYISQKKFLQSTTYSLRKDGDTTRYMLQEKTFQDVLFNI